MNVFVADEQSDDVDVAALRSLVLAVLEAEHCPPDTEVSVLLVDDRDMAHYNERFMERDGPTDVLSFPLEELRPGSPPAPGNGGPPPVLGDVVIDPPYIRRQAAEMGAAFEDELSLMVVHGVLHLLGYDHADDAEADRMEARERELLEAAGRRRR